MNERKKVKLKKVELKKERHRNAKNRDNEKHSDIKRLNENNRTLKYINNKIERLSLNMEHTKFNDYVNYLRNPRKLFLPNFLSGLYRGFGIAVGFTILTALVIYLLQQIVMLNLPVLSEFISKIVKLVEFYTNKK